MNLNKSPVITYPETSNKQFAKEIYLKKEFNKSKYAKIDTTKSYNDISNKMCNQNDGFKLTNNQIFLKNFLSPNTPYNSLLLYHGVGVGKTCAAISIAEQFFNVYSKKCIILMPTSLKENFKKQIFDINNLNHCTSDKYIKMVPDRNKMNKESIEKKVHKLINSRYDFFGFLEFAKVVISYEEKFKGSKNSDDKFIQVIEKVYSNRVIIIDEVHNARAEKDDTIKKIPNILLKVLQHAKNVKLILLTATPMFNGVTEIVWILNYMLANDKRPLLEINKCFDGDGVVTDQGIELITNASLGRISYMRGENPYSFPFKLYPFEANNDMSYLKKKDIPTNDIYGKKLDEDLRISTAFAKTLTVSKMSAEQERVYKLVGKNTIIEDTEECEDCEENEHGKYNVSSMIQISNIVYPNSNKSNVIESFGKKGFNNNFNHEGMGWKFKVSYKNKNKEFLNSDHLKEYSAKLNSIVDYILNSDGIVYVYSYYIYSALLPLAIALEHRGFKRSNGSTILESPKSTKTNPQTQYTYSLLTRDSQLKTDIQTEIDKITSKDNINGEKVKVILGTSVTAEGINFKRIRQIHIVEPWFHLNKLEQVTGRAIRMCSHIDLPQEKRNVTIYRHCSMPEDDKKVECTDLRIYRIAENKQKYINMIEKILIENSVDCNLNEPIIKYDRDMKINIKTSQNVTKLKYSVGDRLDDKHTLINCSNKVKDNDKIDTVTFSNKIYIDDIPAYVELVKLVFNKKPIKTYKGIYEELSNILTTTTIDEDLLKFTLEEMLNKKIPIEYNDEEGYLLYLSNLYMFQPYNSNTIRIMQDDRMNKDNMIQQNVILIKNTDAIINQGVESMIKSIADSIEKIIKYKKHVPEKFIYDYVIDRLTFSNFNLLLEEMSKLDNDMFDNEHINYILNSLERAFIFRKHNDIYYALNIYNGTLDNIYTLDFEKKKYKKGRDIDLVNFLQYEFELIDLNEGYGFMEFTKTNNIQFKIMGSNNKSGTVCGTGSTKHDEYIDKINSIDNTILGKLKHTNKELCIIIELLLRSRGMFSRPFQHKMKKMKN